MEKKIDKTLFTLLAFFLGYLGVDRFMRGQIGFGLLKILDFTGIWALVDFIIALTKLGNYENEFIFIDGNEYEVKETEYYHLLPKRGISIKNNGEMPLDIIFMGNTKRYKNKYKTR
jgi:hypothetical protein